MKRVRAALPFFIAMLLLAGCAGEKAAPVQPENPSGTVNASQPAAGGSPARNLSEPPGVLRGAMIGPEVEEADLRDLAGWGANHVRYQLTWDTFPHSPADTATIGEYEAWLEGQLERLDRLIPVCEEQGLHIVVDMHTPVCGRYPGGSSPLIFSIFRNRTCQEQFARDWERIAERYRGKRIIWGYDLLNEPNEGAVPAGLMDWRQLAGNITGRIRAIDPDARIVYEPAVDTLPAGIRQNGGVIPLQYDNVAYSIHIYSPPEFTHQGVGGRPSPVYYPSAIGGTYWDLGRQRELYRPVVDFQKKYNATIYIGEFSVIRWAPTPDAERWLSDAITIIEENHWNAAYHAFREWHGWSVEHGSDLHDQNPVNYTTARKQVLLDWYAKNG